MLYYIILYYIISYYIILYYIILYYIILYYIIHYINIYYYNILILWDHRHICGPSLTETSMSKNDYMTTRTKLKAIL